MEEVDVMGRDRMVGQGGEAQAGLDKVTGMVGAMLVAHLAAFQGYRWTDLAHGHGLDALGPKEIDQGAAEEGGQVQGVVVEVIDAAVMGVQARVVVDIQAGEEATSPHDVRHPAHEVMLRGGGHFAAWPDPVVIRLMGQVANASGGGGDIADEDAEGPWQPRLAEAFNPLPQQVAQGLPADGLVAVQEHREKEGRFTIPRQVDQGRPAEQCLQVARFPGQETFG
jgi:hypothetical protein